MKKQYIQPTIDVYQVRMSSMLCMSSLEMNGGSANNTDALGRESDFEDDEF